MADLGSGSAIVAIAAAKLGATRCWAIEIDPEAQSNAALNVEDNDVADVVHLLEGAAPAERSTPELVLVGGDLTRHRAPGPVAA